MNNFTEEDQEEFIQWMKDAGRAKYELTDIHLNEDGEIKTIKKMAWVIKTTPEDWKEFCEVTGRRYEGEMKLLAFL